MMRPWAAVILLILTSLVCFRPVSAADAANLRVKISNLNDTAFTVSWLSASDETGRVQLLDGAAYDDDRGAAYSGTTHYVTVGGLQAKHDYSFDVVSGGTIYDNAAAHWKVTTGAKLEPRPEDLVSGQVKNPDGSRATDAIVSATIYRVQGGFISAPISALVTDGVFRMRLSDARRATDPSNYMEYTPGDRYGNNEVTLLVLGSRGSALVTLEMADPRLHSSDPGQIIVSLTPDPQAGQGVTQQPTSTPGQATTDEVQVVVETEGFGIPDYAIMVTDLGTRKVTRHEELGKNHYRDYVRVHVETAPVVEGSLALTVFLHNPDATCEDPAMENCNYVYGNGDAPVFKLTENKDYTIKLRVDYVRGPVFSQDRFSVTSTVQ